MSRKTTKRNAHEFTSQIHSTVRTGTRFANMENHDERKAKGTDAMACHHCRFYRHGCDEFIGRWHKICSEFKWW